MSSGPDVDTIIGREDEVLSLLNEAYDDWGDEEHFRWKYDQFPDYDPEEHTFAVVVDGELAAFRRVFRKELVHEGDSVTTFVLGDTAVAPNHQGKGIYSDLHAKTINYCGDVEGETTITYNNVDNVTFKANRNRGWEFSVLPLRLFIHSYEAVLSHYADLVLPEESVITSIVGAFGKRLALKVGDEHISVAEVLKGDGKDRWRLEVSASSRAVAQLVETTSNDSIVQVVPTGVGLLASGDISFGGRPDPSSSTNGSTDSDVKVVNSDILSDGDVDAMIGLCGITKAGQPSFRRKRRDIEHMLSYPGAEVLVIRDGKKLVGFAIVGPYKNNRVVEARVLDMAAPSDPVARQLYRELERYTDRAGYDLIVIISDRDPGPGWASIDQQVCMWNQLTGKSSTKFPPSPTMYDVL